MYRFFRDDLKYPDEECTDEESTFDDFIDKIDYLARLLLRSGKTYSLHGYYVYYQDNLLFRIRINGEIVWMEE